MEALSEELASTQFGAREEEAPPPKSADRATALLCQEPVARRVFQCLSGSSALALPAQLSSAFARRYAFRRLRRLALRLDPGFNNDFIRDVLSDWPLRRLVLRLRDPDEADLMPGGVWDALRAGVVGQTLRFLKLATELRRGIVPDDWVGKGGPPFPNLRRLDLFPEGLPEGQGTLLSFVHRIAGPKLEKLRLEQPLWHHLPAGQTQALFAGFPQLSDLMGVVLSSLEDGTRKRLGQDLVSLGSMTGLCLTEDQGHEFKKLKALRAEIEDLVMLPNSWNTLTTVATDLFLFHGEVWAATDGEEKERQVNADMSPLSHLPNLRHLWVEVGPDHMDLLGLWTALKKLPLTSLRVQVNQLTPLPDTLPTVHAPVGLRKLYFHSTRANSPSEIQAEERWLGPLLAGGVVYEALEEVGLRGPPFLLGRLAEGPEALPNLRWASWRCRVVHSPGRSLVAQGAFAQEEVASLAERSSAASRGLAERSAAGLAPFDHRRRL